MEQLKVVVIGDVSVGKTSLLITYIHNKFPEDYVPSRIDTYLQDVTVDDKSASLILWDTAGGEDYPRLRPLEYPRTDVFLICFSLVDIDSYENVQNVYHTELRRHCPKIPIILVGTKLDMRNDKETNETLRDKNLKPISIDEGFEMGKRIAAVRYMECSSLLGIGVKEIFEEVVRVESQYARSSRRCVLS